jgi:release factor glutamine methyltransferase
LAKKLGAKNRYFASDISPAALKVAKKNAEHHKTHVLFKQSDILKAWKNQHFDIIIANLPYLDRETDASTKFEPKLALIADKKGLAVIEELFKTLPSTLRPHPSVLFLEIGHDQGEALKKLAKKYLPASPEGGPAFETKIYKDLSGHARYAIIQSNIV